MEGAASAILGWITSADIVEIAPPGLLGFLVASLEITCLDGKCGTLGDLN